MNKIYIPATKPEDWKKLLAEPDKHWKQGYSASSLAYCWHETDGFPSCIKKVFSKSDVSLFHNIDLLIAIPEFQVPLPGGSAPSQNDVFVLAKGNGELISITVEGKVSEPFDKPVSEWFQNPSPGKKKRLKFLCEELGIRVEDVSNIRYQLLHRTVSAMIEAKNFNASNALMIVHSFSQTDEWFEDYSEFASLFNISAKLNDVHFAGEINGVNLYLGWIKGEQKYLSMMNLSEKTDGIVTARECDCCGHHEIGITNESGEYIQLKAGMRVKVL